MMQIIRPFAFAASVSGPPTANLAAWFKSDTGITKDGSNYVSAWEDQSENGYDLAQATGSYQPLYVASQVNGYPAIRFDGSNDLLYRASVSVSQPVTVYTVLKQISWSGDFIYGTNDSSPYGAALAQNGTSPQLALYANASTYVAHNGNLSTSSWGIVCAVYNGASSRLRVDDGTATTGNPGANGVSELRLGKQLTYAANFDIAEWLIYSEAHDTDTEEQVRDYLDARYSIIS